MIISVNGDYAHEIFSGRCPKALQNLQRSLERRLQSLDSARHLDDLRSPPGNRLEHLIGDRAGQFSIRINDQYRICFRWLDGNAYDVEVVDYH